MDWTSPGGLYVVPPDFQARFQSEFPGYRIRWSLRKHCWQIEQPTGTRGALTPIRVSEEDDSMIRARDGYWLVMELQPGSRMPCPGLVQVYPRITCGYTIPVALRQSKESICPICRLQHRDGRTIAAYWPFDELFLEHLRYSDPLKDGTRRQRIHADRKNAIQDARGERDTSNIIQAHAADLHRHIVGIKQFAYSHTAHPLASTPIPIRD